MAQPDPNKTVYTVAVKTSDIDNAGTDANVFVRLIGTKGSSQPIELKASINHTDKFERKHSDVFVFPDQDLLGDIRQVQIWHDNSGKGPAWHLSNVAIHDETSNIKYDFHCGRWLGKEYDDGQICRVLNCTGQHEKTPKHYRMQENHWQQSQNLGVQSQQQAQLQAIPAKLQSSQMVNTPKEAVELQFDGWGYPYGCYGGGYGYPYGYGGYGYGGGYPMYGGGYGGYGYGGMGGYGMGYRGMGMGYRGMGGYGMGYGGMGGYGMGYGGMGMGYGGMGGWPFMGGWGGMSWSWSW